jgi:hypothetical protein
MLQHLPGIGGGVTPAVEIARQEWAEGHRRLEAERERPARYRRLHAQVEVVTEQLRRRLGSVFTLEELAAEYRRAEPWVQETVAELPTDEQWPPGLTTATDAAFHLYARGARDYEP